MQAIALSLTGYKSFGLGSKTEVLVSDKQLDKYAAEYEWLDRVEEFR